MPSQNSSHDYDLLDHLIEEFNERFRKGERPSLKEYCDRHPALADELRELLPAMAQVEQAKDALAQEIKTTAPAAPSLQHLGDFRILRKVGHGGMGVVYEAEQVSLGRRVALKVLTDRMIREDRQKRRFEREARAAARLHHTNIVPVFGTGEAEGVPYYVMQFIQGMGLDAVVVELSRMSGGSGSLVHGEGEAPAEPLTSGSAGASPSRSSPASPGALAGLSAQRMARSLLTGAFLGQEATQAHPTLQPESPKPALAALAASESGRAVDASGTTSSVTLPGQKPSADGKGRRLSYWQSVARIGMQVADALEYAHKQGIVHRDVKPSNLLLDLDGTVWVTDFGLAKAEGGENLTLTGDVLGTLRYMPPEAFDGKADARGDIYSLGLTLYELVALRPAFDQCERNQLVKQVTTAEIKPLGTLRRRVPRDLETIVHKAIDREPARRYQTAGELRDDLQRFVDDEPIRARRQTLLEHYVRWARHHPGIAVLGAVLTAVLVLATAASLIVASRMSALAQSEAQAAEEERKARQEAEEGKARQAKLREQAEFNFGKAQAAVDDYFTRVSENRLLQVPGLKDLRKELLLSALKFYQDFLKDRADDPTVRAGLAGAHLRVGKIRSELGERKEAKVAYDQALQLYQELLRANPTDAEAQHGRASCHMGLGRYTEAAAIWEKLVKPDDPHFQRELAQAYSALALSRERTPSDADRALAYHRKALTVRERLLAMDPNDPYYRGDLSQTLNNIAAVLGTQRRTAEALALYRRAAANCEEAYRLRPADTVLASWVAIQQSNVARLESALGNTDAAVIALRRAVEVRRWMVRDNPAVESLRTAYIGDSELLVDLLLKHERPDQALRAVRDTREVLESVRNDSPDYLICLARALILHVKMLKNGRADLSPAEQTEYGQTMDGAAAAIKRAVAADGRFAVRISRMPQLKDLLERADVKDLVAKAAELATTPNKLAKDKERLAAAQRVLKEKEKLACTDPSNRRVRADRAAAHQAVGLIQINLDQLDEARPSLEKALALWQALAAEQPRDAQVRTDLAAGQMALADLHWKADRLAEWRRFSRQGVESLEEAVRLAPSASLNKQLGTTHLTLADRCAELGLWAESAAELRLADARIGYDSPDGGDLFKHGLMFLLAGDQDGYRQCAKEGLRRGASTNDPVLAHRVLYLLSLSSDAPGDVKQRDRLAAIAMKKHTVEWVPFWGHLSRAAADYRAGKAREVVDRLRESLRRDQDTVSRPSAGCFLALALHRLGRLDEAKAALREPTRQIENYTRTGVVQGRLEWPFGWANILYPHREASKVVLGRTDPHGSYVRLLRGRTYARLGEKALAGAEFAAAVAARPNDPDVLALRARIYSDLDQKDLAAADIAKCKELVDKLLAGAIEDPDMAGRLANSLIVLADGPGTVLKPTRLKSEGGATLTVQLDGSVLASGHNPRKDIYTIEAEVGPGSFSCLCLEALPHASLPRNGPGRYPAHGNFCLTEISLRAAPADRKGLAAPVSLIRAGASYASDISADMGGAGAAIDGKATTYWDVWPRAGAAHTAWFELAKPVGGAGQTRLTIRLEFQSRYPMHGLGRFRLSLLTARPIRMAMAGWLGATSLDSFGGYGRLSAVLAAGGGHSELAARMFVKALEAEKTPETLRAIHKAAVHDAAVFAELIKLRPKDAELWTARGTCLAEIGKQKEADEAFAQAEKLKPK
jgi:serine/threonine-protein kinase